MAASAGHLLFGWLSDVTGRRRPWVAAGLLLSCLLLLAIGHAVSLPELLALIIAWQLAINMMMSPQGRLAMVTALVASAVLPLLLLPLPANSDPAPEATPVPSEHPLATVRRMWLARLALQIAEATLFAYLYLWFVAVDAGVTDNRVAGLFAATLVVSAPVALGIGRWADCHGQPFRPLVLAAVGAAIGLVGMALSTELAAAMAAFGVFSLASALFLALHSAQSLRVLARPRNGGVAILACSISPTRFRL